MTKTFTYFRKTGEILRPINIGGEIEYEWDGDVGYDFDYTPNDEDFSNALIEIVTNHYFGEVFNKNPKIETYLKGVIKDVIEEQNLSKKLADFFEDELKEWFEDEAQESENNN